MYLLKTACATVLGLVTLTGCTKPAEKPTEKPLNNATSTSATTATAVEGGTKVTIATESSFVPFSYKDAQGNLVGFEIDLAHALCTEAKLDCNIISQDFDGLIPGLNAKKFDAIMAGMSATPDRQKVVAFSEPYFQNALVVIGKKGVDINPNELSGKNVAAQRSTVAAEYLEKHFPKAVAKLYDTQENAYMDLDAGRAEAIISDKAPVLAWLKTPKGQKFEVKGAPIDIDDKIAIAMRPNDPLIAKFNTALTTLKGNGTYDKISQKYFADVK